MLFTRSSHNPILKPDKNHGWESLKVYNPGAIYYNEAYHLFYRAVGREKNWHSSIGYAVSRDGENFKRFSDPMLTPVTDKEKRGLEDPRITKINDLFYMAYAAYDGITPRLSLAVSKNLKKWHKRGPVFSNWMFDKAGGRRVKFINGKPVIKPKLTEWSKSGALFPEKINGKFLMLFGEYNIWFAESDDGIKWIGDQSPFLGARKNHFDSAYVEMGPPPIKTNKGWLVLYHGIDNKRHYRIGYLLLDIDNPKKIIFRSKKPIFEPRAPYEMTGIIDILPGGLDELEKMDEKKLNSYINKLQNKHKLPHVVFCCGAVLKDDILRIYYGAGDTYICTATADINDILNYKSEHPNLSEYFKKHNITTYYN